MNFSEKPAKTLFWVKLFHRRIRPLLDAVILCGALIFAYLLRFEFTLFPKEARNLLIQLPIVYIIQVATLYFFGAYGFFWRFISLNEIRVFIKAGTVSCSILLFLRLVLPNSFQEPRIPISIILIDTILAYGGVISLRFLRRYLYEHYERQLNIHPPEKVSPQKVLLVGAGQAGVLALREISRRDDLNLKIVGLVDDDPRKQGLTIQKYRVIGTTADLPFLVGRHQVDQVIIAINNASRQDFQRILDTCRKISVKVQVIPSLSRMIQGKYKISRIRDVQIEDLLGRDVVHLDEEAIRKFIAHKRVMVTGAGGSIGSEMARQVARFGPADLQLVERAEFVLFEIDRELRGAYPEARIIPLVADINDVQRMRSLFEHHRPEVIFHAAAHKHVPMMEFNPSEAIKNNCLGTNLLGELAGEYGVEAFVFISTDKAVNPTSVMGASKRLAEMVVQDLNQRCQTRFLAVRFGNVLGSSGSVINIFRDQIQKGGPVTVTHKERPLHNCAKVGERGD